jgi:hypothetical protein
MDQLVERQAAGSVQLEDPGIGHRLDQ